MREREIQTNPLAHRPPPTHTHPFSPDVVVVLVVVAVAVGVVVTTASEMGGGNAGQNTDAVQSLKFSNSYDPPSPVTHTHARTYTQREKGGGG